jgi:signal peptidase II
LRFWTTFLGVFITDYLTKAWIRSNLAIGEVRNIIGDFLVITYWENTGAAFGYFKGATVFLAIVSAACICVSLFLYPKLESYHRALPVFLGLVSGGAMGNLIDRLRAASVTDFISLKIFPPVFNVADSAIVIGSILLALFVLLFEEGQHL